jgi:hypothetical protein
MSRSIKEKDRAIIQLRRELIDIDTQLDSERRKRASMRSALEKAAKKESKSETSSKDLPQPTSFRLSTKTPPSSPPQKYESRGQMKGLTPEPHATPTSSQYLSDTSRIQSRREQSGISDRRSGSAPHSRIIRPRKFEETNYNPQLESNTNSDQPEGKNWRSQTSKLQSTPPNRSYGEEVNSSNRSMDRVGFTKSSAR